MRYDSPQVNCEMMMMMMMMIQFWVLYFYVTFLCYWGSLNLNSYISKKVHENFPIGFKVWWSCGQCFFFCTWKSVTLAWKFLTFCAWKLQPVREIFFESVREKPIPCVKISSKCHAWNLTQLCVKKVLKSLSWNS